MGAAAPSILPMMAQMLLSFRNVNAKRNPRELRMLPWAYRAWRIAAPDRTDYFGVPVRCCEMMPHGFDVMAVA